MKGSDFHSSKVILFGVRFGRFRGSVSVLLVPVHGWSTLFSTAGFVASSPEPRSVNSQRIKRNPVASTERAGQDDRAGP